MTILGGEPDAAAPANMVWLLVVDRSGATNPMQAITAAATAVQQQIAADGLVPAGLMLIQAGPCRFIQAEHTRLASRRVATPAQMQAYQTEQELLAGDPHAFAALASCGVSAPG